MPRWPGGWFAGSFHSSRPGWPSSVESRDHVAPSSRLSNTPADSAPARSRPCAAVRPETFDSLRSPFSYERPSLESVQLSPSSALRHTPAPCHSLAAAAYSAPRRGVVDRVVDRPAVAERPAHAPVAAVRVALEQEAALPRADEDGDARGHLDHPRLPSPDRCIRASSSRFARPVRVGRAAPNSSVILASAAACARRRSRARPSASAPRSPPARRTPSRSSAAGEVHRPHVRARAPRRRRPQPSMSSSPTMPQHMCPRA